MVEIAEIFRIHGPAYREKFGDRMPQSHIEAMEAIEQCRTEALGGHVYYCENCQTSQYSYHSCKNRHCPKCQNDSASAWLQRQHDMLLPLPHFLVTFTLPDPLRELCRSNQEIFYNILFRASSQALQQLALDPRFVGGQIGMIGVLHTWTRKLLYHPHVHYLVPAGGLSLDGKAWLPANPDFLVPVKALSIIFRAKFRDELRKTPFFELVPSQVWNKDWVVHCQPVGSGKEALKYLAPYIFRVAISNHRILNLENGEVTFQYKDSATDKVEQCTLPAEEFIRRFLQHILPHRFVKVRYYGLFSTSHREDLQITRKILKCQNTEKHAANKDNESDPTPKERNVRCPKCGSIMQIIEKLRPKNRSP